MKTTEEQSTLPRPRGEALENQNAPFEQSDSPVSRRQMLKRAGIVLGASGALAALAIPARATSENHSGDQDADQIAGLWQGVVSAQDGSFPPFKTFEIYGERIWISSGQTDLTTAALASSLWATFKRVGHRKFRGIGRFWTYDANANPTGFGAVDQTTTVSEDGKSYHGEGPLQFFDNSGNPLGLPTTLLDDGTRITFP